MEKKKNSQAKHTKISKKLHVTQEVIRSWSKPKRDIFNMMLWIEARFPFNFWSQYKIGHLSGGYCRKTTNEVLSQLADEGLITKRFRWYQTCVYTVDSYFKTHTVIANLSPIVPSILGFLASVTLYFLKKERHFFQCETYMGDLRIYDELSIVDESPPPDLLSSPIFL